MITIYPRGRIEERCWSFGLLFIFPDELSEDWAAARFQYPQKVLRDASAQRDKVYCADREGRRKTRVTVKVRQNWDLAVQISRPDQVERECVEHLEETSQGTRSRGNKPPIYSA
jgi:hypothetical protein